MSKDKRKYLSAYVPEVKPKETPKRNGTKSSGRLEKIEEAIAAFNDLLTKQNRDNLDAMYNIDMDNMSSSMRRLFQSYDDGITSAKSSIDAWANEMEAGFSAVAQWQNETTNSISSIEGKTDANTAQITQMNQWKGEMESSMTAIQSAASSQGAQITALTSWQSNTGEELVESVAVLREEADETGAALNLLVTYDGYGNVDGINAAEIAMAVSEDESFIRLIADNVNVEGVVTFESLENDGESVINGNNILLKLDGSDDDGDTYLESKNGLRFIYQTSGGNERSFADIYTSVDGSDSDETSRYALNIVANRFRNEDSDYVYASLKMEAAGRVSILSQYGMYLNSYDRSGYITLEALDNVRIIPFCSYESLVNDTGRAYCFCTDGIYYNGKLMLETP